MAGLSPSDTRDFLLLFWPLYPISCWALEVGGAKLSSQLRIRSSHHISRRNLGNHKVGGGKYQYQVTTKKAIWKTWRHS
ncbi:hypothetical protein BJY01DRAFT_223745 [Aspergillus pseudoustus]|uniref:Secreted protein n=1 Tax=Aspergillus pseudoustus TaxID=1810923 RepID=A0ABR4J5S4_9EURO